MIYIYIMIYSFCTYVWRVQRLAFTMGSTHARLGRGSSVLYLLPPVWKTKKRLFEMQLYPLKPEQLPRQARDIWI